jgi:hypothetical protein
VFVICLLLTLFLCVYMVASYETSSDKQNSVSVTLPAGLHLGVDKHVLLRVKPTNDDAAVTITAKLDYSPTTKGSTQDSGMSMTMMM